MIERGDNVAACCQKLGEPGVVEAATAAAIGEHDERTLRGVRSGLGVLVELETGEERHEETRGGARANRGGIDIASARWRSPSARYSSRLSPTWEGALLCAKLAAGANATRAVQSAARRASADREGNSGARPADCAWFSSHIESLATARPHRPHHDEPCATSSPPPLAGEGQGGGHATRLI